jgi:predicted Zn-dependent protease
MNEIIPYLLDEGTKTGFSAVEAFGENISKLEYECFPGESPALHSLEIHRITSRAFRETGDPVSFSLSNPDAVSIKSAFLETYNTNMPGQKQNFREHLPAGVQKTSPAIFDESVEQVDVHAFNEFIDRINEIVIANPFRDLKLRRIFLSKILKKVYIANSNGLDARYMKTQFTLSVDAILKDNRIVVKENRIFFNRLEPYKIISRAFNLLNSLTEETISSSSRRSKNLPLIFSPEASVFILKEFSHYFKINADKEMMDIQYPSVLNIVDNTFMDEEPGSVPFDDEGVQSGEKFLIRKGIFSQVVTDISNAFQAGIKSTGNGFRTERSAFPNVRFSNLYIKPTVLPLRHLMTDAGDGILVLLLRLKQVDKEGYLFSAYGYRFRGDSMMEPVHFYFRTTFRSYFLKMSKISKEIKFFYSTYNIGSPYILVEAKRKTDTIFEV